MIEATARQVPLAQIYRQLYPWTSLNQFVEQIKRTIAYKSPDNSLIALNKPYGVGTFTPLDRNASKQNQDKLYSLVPGSTKYCLSDALGPLADELGSREPYHILKGIDRYMSGLVLITNDLEKQAANFRRSIAESRVSKKPPYGMRAITCGYPLVKSRMTYEKVGIELIEVDELGDHKEPVIRLNPSLSFQGSAQNKRIFQAELDVKKINREYSASLVELYTSNLRWDFPRCYISSKTSFILGDVRFSKRIREILGKPIQVSAFKACHKYEDNYEPLNGKLQGLLGVTKNASIPLMLDLHAIRLKGFDRKQKTDLHIKSPFMPLHFALTAARLNLLCDDSSGDVVHDENSNKSDAVA